MKDLLDPSNSTLFSKSIIAQNQDSLDNMPAEVVLLGFCSLVVVGTFIAACCACNRDNNHTNFGRRVFPWLRRFAHAEQTANHSDAPIEHPQNMATQTIMTSRRSDSRGWVGRMLVIKRLQIVKKLDQAPC